MVDTGEKLTIPQPQKLSGEDPSQDIRMRIKQIERYLKAKKRKPDEWGSLAFSFVEKSAESVWSSELCELENAGKVPTWEMFTETMISFFGTQVLAREAQVRYKACKQESTVADFVRRLKACIQMLENTPLKPSLGQNLDQFIDNLAPEPNEWVLSQAPTQWYSSEREVFMKALQWETNQSHRADTVKSTPKVFFHKKQEPPYRQEFKKGKRNFHKRKFASGGPPTAGFGRGDGGGGRGGGGAPVGAKRPRTEGHRIPADLYAERIKKGQCFRCGLQGHRADKCGNGFRDAEGKMIP